MEDTTTTNDKEVKKRWEQEQLELKQKLILTNNLGCTYNSQINLNFAPDLPELKYVAGVDISFVKENTIDACACLIILEWPSLTVLDSRFEMIQLTEPYIPGFLAFREVSFLLKLLSQLQTENPQIYPQLIFVDGNGYLHPRGFGLASHLGVLTGVPCIGIGKTLMYVDGLEIKGVKEKFRKNCTKAGDHILLIGDSGECWGAAFKSTMDCTNPIFVSIGHKVDLVMALELVKLCCLFRIPEPTRQADLQSREFLRKNYYKK